jgi:hypothetical protein
VLKLKGRLEEVMSRARFVKTSEFYVQYRDMKELVQLPVAEFWKVADIVPQWRIARIIERKNKHDVTSPNEPNRIDVVWDEEVIYESSNADLLALRVVVKTEADPELVRFSEMRDALNVKGAWQRYVELERIKQLRNEGRELLGELIYVEEKRDGENLSLWLEEGDVVHVSSHNMVNADPAIVSRLQAAPEYDKACAFLRYERATFNHEYMLYGELVNKGKGPTRIEPAHKYAHWHLFDIYDTTSRTFLPYPLLFQHGYHWKIPVIPAIEQFTVYQVEDLYAKIEDWKTWARKHKREGVVGKIYKNGVLIGFKEKIDLPKLEGLPRVRQEQAIYPPMPEDRILRAMLHAYDEVTTIEGQVLHPADAEHVWRDKAVAMPALVKHLVVEAREHNFEVPKKPYDLYVNTPLEKILAARAEAPAA